MLCTLTVHHFSPVIQLTEAITCFICSALVCDQKIGSFSVSEFLLSRDYQMGRGLICHIQMSFVYFTWAIFVTVVFFCLHSSHWLEKDVTCNHVLIKFYQHLSLSVTSENNHIYAVPAEKLSGCFINSFNNSFVSPLFLWILANISRQLCFEADFPHILTFCLACYLLTTTSGMYLTRATKLV